MDTKCSSVRPPFVRLTYEVEIEDEIVAFELPFVAGVLADLAGKPDPPLPSLEERRFVSIERGNFEDFLAACEPRLAFEVENLLEKAAGLMEVELRFHHMTDFEPEGVARQIPGLLEALIAERPEAFRQLDEVLHAPEFQRLEASWRGLQYLLWHIQTSDSLKVRVLNVSKLELLAALRDAPAPNRSEIFRQVHDEPYTIPCGETFAILIGDYDFSNDADDLELLEGMAAVAAGAHAPFIAGISPQMFGLESFAALSDIRNPAKIFQHCDYVRWRSFRDTEEAGYVALILPRMLLRLPYGETAQPAKRLPYRESAGSLLWGTSAYALGVRIAEAFRTYHCCAAIRGVEGGGLVTDLPLVASTDSDGNVLVQGPLEIPIDERREIQFIDSGFNCLVQCKGAEMAAFFTATTCRKARRYDTEAATQAARVAATLPYVLAVSRFAHYLKAIARDKIWVFLYRGECERFLNEWIRQYVIEDDSAPLEVKARFPLRSARIEVDENPEAPGRCRAIAFLRPHFQLEETALVRLVIDLPKKVVMEDTTYRG